MGHTICQTIKHDFFHLIALDKYCIVSVGGFGQLQLGREPLTGGTMVYDVTALVV